MRTAAILTLAALAACTPGSVPLARQPTIDTAEPVFADRAVTARSDPSGDWYVFGVHRACSSVAIAVESRRELAVEVIEPDGTEQSARAGSRRTRAPRDAMRLDHAQQGHFYVRVRGEGDPAPYRLRVHDATSGFECGDLPPPVPTTTLRPRSTAQVPAPAGTIGASIDAWLHYGRAGYVADIGAGFDDGIRRTTAQVLDDHGEVVPGVELRVEAYEAHRARGELVGDTAVATHAWSIALRRELPPAPPLTARVVDRWTFGGTTFVAFDRGTIDGVAVGWRGNAGQVPLEVVEVHGIHGVARLAGTTLDAIVGLAEIRLTPSA